MHRLNRLKYRIILSHVVPILATVPLVAASVYYAMQMQIVVHDNHDTHPTTDPSTATARRTRPNPSQTRKLRPSIV